MQPSVLRVMLLLELLVELLLELILELLLMLLGRQESLRLIVLRLVLLLELLVVLLGYPNSRRCICFGLARSYPYLRVGNHMTTSSHGPTYTNCDVLRVELHRSPRSNPHPSRDSWLGFA